MAKSTTSTTIDPVARYRVTMIRPVRRGSVLYRPGQPHEMTGAMVIEVAAAAGVSEAAVATVMTAARID